MIAFVADVVAVAVVVVVVVVVVTFRFIQFKQNEEVIFVTSA